MRRTVIMLVALALLVIAAPATAGGRPLTADLAAANEVGGGDGDATGFAHVTLNQGLGKVCFAVTTDGLTTPAVAAHIHAGAAGVNGPIVVDFQWATTGGEGCVDADRDVIKAIRQNPGDYYVNVHNPTVPPGAVRGQLSK